MSIEKRNFTDAETLRKKAEEELKAKRKKAIKPNLATDPKRLLHELQVHQLELEMQNEELLRANETAEAALKKYTMLYDLAPMGYFTLDEDGRICDLNFTGAELLDDKRYTLVNSKFQLFISKESQDVFNDFFNKVYTSAAKESCTVKLGYNDKVLSFVYMEGIITGDDRRCLLSVIDISEIKQQSGL
ncbi:MAG: PAS domain-containing protein [Bacteroidales bacterium]|nr:PAS domain-containing protein [Bacteroidales bacterium]